jgi:hypothetical protein
MFVSRLCFRFLAIPGILIIFHIQFYVVIVPFVRFLLFNFICVIPQLFSMYLNKYLLTYQVHYLNVSMLFIILPVLTLIPVYLPNIILFHHQFNHKSIMKYSVFLRVS